MIIVHFGRPLTLIEGKLNSNKFKLQGQEHVEDLGLNWHSFKR